MAAPARSCYNPATGIYTSPRLPLSFPSDPNLSMIQFLFRNVNSYPNRLALVDAESNQSLTFAELRSTISSFAAGIAGLGIKKGDVVLIFAPNSILFPVAFLAVVSLGAVATTVNPLYTVSELSKQVADSGAKLIITVPSLWDKARALNLPAIFLSTSASIAEPHIYYFQDLIRSTPPAAAAAELKQAEIKQNDTAALLYSSGTTGASKGVVLSHRNFITTAMMVAVDQDVKGEPVNTFLCFLPMFHIFGLSVITYGQLARGNTVVVMGRFEMELTLRSIERYRVSYMFVVPPVMIALAKQGKVTKYDLSSLRMLGSGAAPLGKDVMEEVSKIFPNTDVVQVNFELAWMN